MVSRHHFRHIQTRVSTNNSLCHYEMASQIPALLSKRSVVLLTCSAVLFVTLSTMSFKNAKVGHTESDSGPVKVNSGGRKADYDRMQVYNLVQVITQKAVVDLQNLEQVDDIPHWDTCPRWFELAKTAKQCLTSRLSRLSADSFWTMLHPTVAGCGVELLKNVLHSKYLVNSDDVKAVILPYDGGTRSSAVTVGIGHDINAEKRLKDFVGNVTFYGADPIPDDGEVFREIGAYEQVAVAAKRGAIEANILRGRKYGKETVEAITLSELISDRFKLNTVDYLFMDIEGEEYQILQQLINPEANYLGNLTICQISMELHGPLEDYRTDYFTFSRTFTELIKQSNFLPLWVPAPTSHHRVFLVDWISPYCVQKFFRHWC